MASNRFTDFSGNALDNDSLGAELKAAKKTANVYVGSDHLFWSKLMTTAVIPLNEIERAFSRIEHVRTKVCCGPATFDICHLVLLYGGSEAAIELDSDARVHRILGHLKEAEAGIETGKP